MDYFGRALNYPSDESDSDITIISEHHGWRTLGGVRTKDYDACRKAIRNGCHLQKASFDLRHPEEMICDLSNLDSLYNGMKGDKVIQMWKYLDSITKELSVQGVRRICGDGLSPEIALSGPSKVLLSDLKRSLVDDAFSRFHCDVVSRSPHSRMWGITKNRLLVNTSVETMEFHNALCASYGQCMSPEHWDSSTVLNTRYVYEDHSVWRQIEKLSKNKLFLLTAGLPLALGYLAATGDRNIFFTEIHRQNDPGMLNREFAFQDIFPKTSSSEEPWLIIDKAYTGGSIKHAANLIRKNLGYNVEVKTLALFPKSFGAFMSADYAVYAGRLFDVRAHAPRLDRNLWHMQLIVE